MNRCEKLLHGLNLQDKLGVEIGPLDRPLVAKSQGQIIYVDHADTETLRRKYANDPNVNAAKIVNVDAVWGAQTLQECLGQGRKVDYVIASHVIEHVPDLIGWLEELRSVLKPDGEARLAVPDRRFSFDFFRRETQLCDILNAHVARARVPLPIAVLDYVLNFSPADDAKERPPPITDALLRDALALARDALEQGAYHDVHCWVFTPRSFGKLFEQASELGLINFSCVDFWDTDLSQNEFIVRLRQQQDRETKSASWRRMKDAAGTASGEMDQRRLSEQLLRARARIAALENSTSWRVTAPLRRAVRALKILSSG